MVTEYWKNKAKDVEAIGCKVVVSDLLENNATNEDRANKIDLADWLVRYLSDGTVTELRNWNYPKLENFYRR